MKYAVYYVGDRVFKEVLKDTFFGPEFRKARQYAEETGQKLYRALIKVDFSEHNNGVMTSIKDPNINLDWTPVVDLL